MKANLGIGEKQKMMSKVMYWIGVKLMKKYVIQMRKVKLKQTQMEMKQS